MRSGVNIQPGEVRAVAEQTAQLSQAITARMNRLMDQLSGLHSVWQGPAADSFHARKSEWLTKAAQHNERLAAIAQEVFAAQAGFATLDENGAATLLSTLSDTEPTAGDQQS